MPKPMLKQPQVSAESENLLSAVGSGNVHKQNKQIDKMKTDRLLRKTRSKEYMDAIHMLDAGGHVHNQDKVNEIINTIKKEFPEIEIEGVLLGFVSICYLGKPYEVHSLDLTGEIIEHFKAGQPMTGGLEKARSIAMRGGYEFIEVYVDCCRCVSSNGTVSVVEC